jgi:spermidine synthase
MTQQNDSAYSSKLGLVSIALVAAITLIFELTLTRVLSFVFWNHVVYLTVTVALLGFGISGTLVAVVGIDKFRQQERIAALWFGLGFSIAAAIPLTSTLLVALQNAPSWAKLGVSYFIFMLPFVFSGALISLLLASVSQHRVGRLYAADLIASATGCVAFYFLLPALSGPGLIFAMSAASFVVGLYWCLTRSTWTARANTVGAVVAIGLVLSVMYRPGLFDLRPEPYKEFTKAQAYNPEITIDATTWTPVARIDVLGTSGERSVLPHYTQHPDASYKVITQDGTAHTRLLSKEAIEHLQQSVSNDTERHGSNLVYDIRENPDVAVIGVGGGIDVATALAYGAKSVTGIELNGATIGYARDTFREYTGGMLDDPRIELHNREGRSFLTSTDRRFDVIQVIAIDTFAALSAGAYALSENYLYTVEAFRDYYDRLEEGGVLSFYRFMMKPPRETLRLTMLASSAWKAEGRDDFEQCVVVLGARREGWALAMFKKGRYTASELATIGAAAEKRDLHILYAPKGLMTLARQATDQGVPGVSFEFVKASQVFHTAIAAAKRDLEDEFFAAYPFAVWPTHDDNPFFFEFNKLGAVGFPDLSELRGDSVSATLMMILGQAGVLSLVAILLPLALSRRAGLEVTGAGAFSGYFAAIGLAFMLVEIALIQKAVLFLGNPMHAISVVLATILVSAGVGSLIQARATDLGFNILRLGGLLLVLFLLVISFTITPLFQKFVYLPLPARVAFILGIYFPIGAAMGLFFPAGLQALRDERAAFVPWAWGINGCTSVFGSVVAILLALSHGFTMVIVLGATIYFVAWMLGAVISPSKALADEAGGASILRIEGDVANAIGSGDGLVTSVKTEA